MKGGGDFSKRRVCEKDSPSVKKWQIKGSGTVPRDAALPHKKCCINGNIPTRKVFPIVSPNAIISSKIWSHGSKLGFSRFVPQIPNILHLKGVHFPWKLSLKWSAIKMSHRYLPCFSASFISWSVPWELWSESGKISVGNKYLWGFKRVKKRFGSISRPVFGSFPIVSRNAVIISSKNVIAWTRVWVFLIHPTKIQNILNWKGVPVPRKLCFSCRVMQTIRSCKPLPMKDVIDFMGIFMTRSSRLEQTFKI